MNERRILDLFILFVIVYTMYSINLWFTKSVDNVTAEEKKIVTKPEVKLNDLQERRRIINKNVATGFIKDDTQVTDQNLDKKAHVLMKACTVLEVFTGKANPKCKNKQTAVEFSDNTLAMIGITVFLFIMLINAIMEVLRVKEEERVKRKLNPDGERRQSLAEFANKKTLRRESSKFGLQLFQISESNVSSDDDKKNRRQNRPYTRGDSTNSYLSEIHRRPQEGSAPASISESADTVPKLVKRQSVAKLFGARPAPMVRRSSFPALPLNPEVQALMLGHRQTSVDSDDESEGRGRRVRIIRRF